MVVAEAVAEKVIRPEVVWKPNYVEILARRQKYLWYFKNDEKKTLAIMLRYSIDPILFINDWLDVFDPKSTTITEKPFVLFPRQAELIELTQLLIKKKANAVVPKSRDMGATYTCCAFSVWLWLFSRKKIGVGWVSKKFSLVDKKGEPDAILEKIRTMLYGLPSIFKPIGFNRNNHDKVGLIMNPETKSTISGYSGDDPGRGGRKTVLYADESSHYLHALQVDKAMHSVSDTIIEISSVNGVGTPFHNKVDGGMEWNRGDEIDKKKTTVFYMMWYHNPFKPQSWFDEEKEKAKNRGQLALFAQEVECDFAASNPNTILKLDWINAAIDAHIKLGIEAGGVWTGGFDVADGEEGDKNAVALRQGIILRDLKEWHDVDVGVSTNRVIEMCRNKPIIKMQWDCIGVGSGVKTEINRRNREGKMLKNVTFVSWNASDPPQDKERRVNIEDIRGVTNGDYYVSMKAQGWDKLRMKFWKTYQAIVEGVKHDPEELISIDSKLPFLQSLKKELLQPTMSTNSNGKIIVDKQPEGTRSPNLADAVMMCYHPIRVVRAKNTKRIRKFRPC